MVKSGDGRGDVVAKHIGCMNGILHLFDRRLLFIGRHHHRRLLAVAGAQQQLEPHSATKAVIEKEPELQKPHEAASPAHSSNIRDVVKDAMYREARAVPIKSFANEGRVTVMKHVDSPRLHMALPRFSYDGRESREALKANMKLKELPRFSLDSKASCINENPGLDPPVKTESGSHSQSSSIVTKLMGLEDFADSITTDESSLTMTISKSNPSPAKQVSSPQSVVGKNSASQSPRQRKTTSVRKATICSKLPLEPAPWKKQDCSPKTAKQSGTSSVYGEIEKRITQLEFQRSGKDLRALKQILEAMQKTRQKLEDQRREPNELKLQESTSEDSFPKQSSSEGTTKSAKVKGKVKISSSNQEPKTQDRTNYRTRTNNKKKITGRNIESEHLAPQCMRVENCTTSGRGHGMVSPRMRHIARKNERESQPNTSTSDFGKGRKQLSKRAREQRPENRKHRVKSMDLQLSNDQSTSLRSEKQCSSYHGDSASAKSESSNSAASYIEIDAASSPNFFSLNSRKQDYVITPKHNVPVAELAMITMEQPSPVSVLDTPFYIEGSPSPVKKISTAFQEDESSSHDEAEWNLQSLNHSAVNNQKSENLSDLVHQPRSLTTEPNETAATNNETSYQSINPGHEYITKMLLAFGLLNDTSIIQTGEVFNSNMFHSLQGEELIKNNDHMKLDQKIQRKLVADVANEILVRKITSGRMFTTGRGRKSPQGLIKEVYLETEHLCKMPYCQVDDEDDWSIRVLAVDMKNQLDGWSDDKGEVPALVLDIERLIFKDLINEVITCEVLGL